MKRLLTALTLVALFAATSFAAVQDFGTFTVDVPAGWTATQDGSTVGIVKNDNAAAISITSDSTDGASVQEIAEAFVSALNGRDLQGADNTFTFAMTNANGVDSTCYVYGEDGKYALIVVTGGENAPDEVDAIIQSLQDK